MLHYWHLCKNCFQKKKTMYTILTNPRKYRIHLSCFAKSCFIFLLVVIDRKKNRFFKRSDPFADSIVSSLTRGVSEVCSASDFKRFRFHFTNKIYALLSRIPAKNLCYIIITRNHFSIFVCYEIVFAYYCVPDRVNV